MLNAVLGGLAVALAPLITLAGETPDPWQGFNRKVYRFNDRVDRTVLRPIAVRYKRVVPDPLETGVHNFFTNLRGPSVFLNQLLQGKPKRAGADLGRFVLNSTVGIGGMIDVASEVGLGAHEEDFGQTFARWRIPSGPFVVLPLWGASSVRDFGGNIVDGFFYPPRFIESIAGKIVTYGVDLLDSRAQLVGADRLVSGDRYLFYRDAYLQRRNYLIHDGRIVDSFLDEDF